ncbi:hypothetical protein PspLS_05146 [Pyricularia sp. CBS 133598]|nr:hypothetical protein PspLS_05146 [Pyricularia sp. CBS 133598]
MGPGGRGYMCYVSIGAVGFPKRPGANAVQAQWGIETQSRDAVRGYQPQWFTSPSCLGSFPAFGLLGKLAGTDPSCRLR